MLSSELRIELEGQILRHSAAFGTGADGARARPASFVVPFT